MGLGGRAPSPSPPPRGEGVNKKKLPPLAGREKEITLPPSSRGRAGVGVAGRPSALSRASTPPDPALREAEEVELACQHDALIVERPCAREPCGPEAPAQVRVAHEAAQRLGRGPPL